MRSGFFDSEITGQTPEGTPIFDRAENAEFYAKYWGNLVGNGIYKDKTNFAPTPGVGMTVNLSSGSVYINGYFGWEESETVYDISEAGTSLARIDTIVARLHYVNREISIEVLEGTPDSSPTAPAITQNEDYFEIPICDVRVNANTSSISAGNITDRREYVRNLLPYEFRGNIPDLKHVKSGTTHQLTGLGTTQGIISCVFTATAAYATGDTFTVDGTPYTIQLSNGEAAEDNLFVSGATVPIVLDTGAKKVNFKAAGSAKLPAGVMAIYKTFRSNGTFTAGVTGTYRITVIGHGGRGANAGHIQFKAGGGGAAGGVAQKTLKLNKGDSYPITVNSSQTSFGSIISAVQGGNASGYTGGTGGIGTGGDINYDGGNGKTASTSNFASGGDGGAYTTEQINKIPILVNRGGSGGSGWNSGSDGSPPLQTSDIGFTPFGCGGGGGGAGDYDSGYREGSGASGAIGAVVVEYLG